MPSLDPESMMPRPDWWVYFVGPRKLRPLVVRAHPTSETGSARTFIDKGKEGWREGGSHDYCYLLIDDLL